MTYNSDGSDTDVAVKCALTSVGDTVTMPVSGDFTWTLRTTIPAGVTLDGRGSIIRDNGTTGSGAGSNLITINGYAPSSMTYPTRITNIRFEQGGGRTSKELGLVYLVGLNTDGGKARVDNCYFNQIYSFPIVYDTATGVIDHNTFIPGGTNIPIYGFARFWNGQGAHSDGSWADSPHFGTNQFMFYEDNVFDFSGTSIYAGNDCYGGARFVARYNQYLNCWIEIHGTESSGRDRGGRACEVYNNTFTRPTASTQSMVNARSTSGVCWGNRLTGAYCAAVRLDCDRLIGSFTPWGYASGENPWDKNVTAGSPFATGTATGGGSLTMIDSGKSWTTNQWQDYILKNTTTSISSYIDSNTGTTIAFRAGFIGDMSFSAGNGYKILKVDQALDAPGQGQCDLISGDDPTAAWPNQITEGWYEWDNLCDGVATTSSATFPSVIRLNEHYFQDHRERPSYTAYVYPHPLVGSVAVTSRNKRKPRFFRHR